ncbi:3'-5' exonuclease [Amphritea sp. 2_MG-2023]|uniref:3'-5' exonuclease n=1 Tax=Amphritea TaxID=515417 RepID=UPI001C06DC28|nr:MULTISPECIES: 3'-5' exonuclease [Amphritea]MBU2965517.1 3'-5' exonuclease domain-containing protein 2 [Amphritea atlantica]MDO6418673.1 3'-5' exonuclease [Amphritea sp. 2_MG-2023]
MKEKQLPPTREEIAQFPPFPAMTREHICLPVGAEALAAAAQDLLSSPFVGFDTESKPVFRKEQASTGPHVIQLCTTDTGYIFQLHDKSVYPVICQVLQAKQVVKVGFGLQSDRSHIRRKLGVEISAILDLDAVYRKLGYRRQLGVKAAIAVQFGQKFTKSKRVSTSNWALPTLSDAQLLYAANDAYAALKILQGLQQAGHERMIKELVVM